jgi:hypothetical protein
VLGWDVIGEWLFVVFGRVSWFMWWALGVSAFLGVCVVFSALICLDGVYSGLVWDVMCFV